MSLTFSVSGIHMRNFLHALSCFAKLCDQVSLEPSQDALSVRGVGASKSTHLLMVLAANMFDRYELRGFGAGSGGAPISPTRSAGMAHRFPAPPAAHGGGLPCFFVETRALLCTVLKSCPSMMALRVAFDSAVSPDHISFVLGTTVGVTRTFRLNLAHGQPERAVVRPELYSFDAVADPKSWASFLSSFPPATGKLGVQPSETRLTLTVSDEFGMDSAKASAAAASIEPRQFLSYRCSSTPPTAAATMGPSAIAQGGVRLSMQHHQQHQSSPQQHPLNESPAAVMPGSGAPQPALLDAPVAKAIDFKPLKVFAFFCESLGLRMRMMSGGRGLPVILEAAGRDVDMPIAHLSLLIAAFDVEIQQQVPAPSPQRPSAALGVPQQSALKSSSSVSSATAAGRGSTLNAAAAAAAGSMAARVAGDSVESGTPDRPQTTPIQQQQRIATTHVDDGVASHISAATNQQPTFVVAGSGDRLRAGSSTTSNVGGADARELMMAPSVVASTTLSGTVMWQSLQAAPAEPEQITSGTRTASVGPSIFTDTPVRGSLYAASLAAGGGGDSIARRGSIAADSSIGITPSSIAKRARSGGLGGDDDDDDRTGTRIPETQRSLAAMSEVHGDGDGMLPMRQPRLEDSMSRVSGTLPPGESLAAAGLVIAATPARNVAIDQYLQSQRQPASLQQQQQQQHQDATAQPRLSHLTGSALHIPASLPIGNGPAGHGGGGRSDLSAERLSGHGIFTLDFDAVDDAAVDAFVYGSDLGGGGGGVNEDDDLAVGATISAGNFSTLGAQNNGGGGGLATPGYPLRGSRSGTRIPQSAHSGVDADVEEDIDLEDEGLVVERTPGY